MTSCSTLVCILGVTASAVPTTVPPATTAPTASVVPQADPQAETPPARAVQIAPITTHKPAYGMGVDDIEIDNGPEKVHLSPKHWQTLVREDPELAQLSRRANLLPAGITLAVVGGTWLTLSTALAFDGRVARTATGSVFQWVAPTAISIAGVAMTAMAIRARRRLHAHRRGIYVSPYASRSMGGLSLSGRF